MLSLSPARLFSTCRELPFPNRRKHSKPACCCFWSNLDNKRIGAPPVEFTKIETWMCFHENLWKGVTGETRRSREREKNKHIRQCNLCLTQSAKGSENVKKLPLLSQVVEQKLQTIPPTTLAGRTELEQTFVDTRSKPFILDQKEKDIFHLRSPLQARAS